LGGKTECVERVRVSGGLFSSALFFGFLDTANNDFFIYLFSVDKFDKGKVD
jgi:hypothetical protein